MTQSQQPYHHNVIESFETQVQKTPHLFALVDEQHHYTYNELNEKANQFAYCLINKNVKQGDFVAILLEPSTEYILWMIAIIKIGAVYLPLDNLAPQTRLKEIIDDANPALIITSEKYQLQLTEIIHPLCLNKQLHLESIGCQKENINTQISTTSAVYMMYTSGSTGQPKGVVIPHHAVINLAQTDNYANIKENEIVAQFSNLAFDASTFEIWSALLNGACLSIIPIDTRTNHTELKTFLDEHAIHYLFLPTGYFHQLIKSSPKTLDSVNVVIFGGEQINKTLVTDFLHYRKKQKLSITLINGYGPTEATTFTCRHIMHEDSALNADQLMSIGTAIKNVKTYVLDENQKESTEGELYIGGINLAIGYHNALSQNNEKFVINPFDNEAPYQHLYKTGDKVRKLDSGELLCLGRLDDQVKIGGFRIHLNEIEQQLMKHHAISLAAVVAEMGGEHHKMLTAYIVFSSENKITHADDVRAFLAQTLPPYMLPSKYVMLDAFPLTLVGKIDKKQLDKIPHTDLSFHIDTSSSSGIEESIKSVWKHLLNRSNINTHKNLFELGANSLLITEACVLINKALQSELQITDMLAHPTIHKLSQYLEGDIDTPVLRNKNKLDSSDIAIIGMSCRLPQANNIKEYWDNLCQGKDCLTRFDIKDMPESPTLNANHVPVKGILSDIEQFDASFFGFSPVDANITDPQHRLFLECVWEALEHAAVAPSKLPSTIISVFAGMTDSSYLQENLLKNQWFCNEHDGFQQRIATSTSMLSTQVSYRLNFKGRSINVNTACSTGLITVDQACQDLILGKSDIAIAGTSSVTVPQIKSYLYQQGSIVSPDGYCRPFAENANGTVFSNGVGVVVLKRLKDAILDNDTVYAVIKASAVNNDGADKLGFTAPSVSGQMACIREALAQANLSADDISFVEAHGTATALGDVIEVNALNSVYREQTDQKQFCALGSVKANIGHTDVTAGIAGLIKTALCLYHKKIPPLIHFKSPNPNLDLDDSAFYINTSLQDWTTTKSKRYAGMSAFGVGGTNIHMILTEYAEQNTTPHASENHKELIVLSAKTKQALDQHTQNFIDYLQSNAFSENQLGQIAYTLQTGREDFQWRRFAVGQHTTDIVHSLTLQEALFCEEDVHHEMVFMFSGQGTQYHNMAMELFKTSPFFRALVQKGIELAKPYLNCDLLEIICELPSETLTQTEYAQPALFIIEYALAQLLMKAGIIPESLIGHSIGEYVAACIAGVFSYEDAIALVCERGLLMATAPKGSMLALECSEEELRSYQEITDVELALHNATHQYVLAGSFEAITSLEKHLTAHHKHFQTLKVSHAFHSRFMTSIEKPFKEIFLNITLHPPTLPIISNLTGNWLSASEAMDPDYWYQHLRHAVQFYKGITQLLQDKRPFFLEVGLGQSLCGFVKDISSGKACVIHTLPNHHRRTSELHQLLHVMGELWRKGITMHMEPLYTIQNKQRISLPTYPFQKQHYWIEADNTPVVHEKINLAQNRVENKGIKIERNNINLKNNYLEPRNDVELTLSRIWEDALGIKLIGIHDNFFDLGGHSLKAIGLIDKINNHYDSKISIQHFYNTPTIFKLGELITAVNQEETNIVVPMSTSTHSNQTIFMCHPASGMISCFNPFISLFPSDFSIYGLQDPGISQNKLIFNSVASMAESYLTAIQKIQPEGPYCLIGYSFGGTLLYEIAKKIQDKNEKIKLLCLIDSWPVFSKIQHDEQHIKKSLQTPTIDLPNALINLTWERIQLLLRHTPTKTKQEMLLIKALEPSDDYLSIAHPLNHWSTFNSGKITCLPINANHESIINNKNSQIIIDYLITNEFL